MPKKCNDQGRAFEYACLKILFEEINKHGKAEIIQDQSFLATLHAWENVSPATQSLLLLGANAAIKKIFELEPLILENKSQIITLKSQPDKKGEEGDVRDVLIIRNDIRWEIGLSLKHNHFAVKHSRLSPKIEIGQKWYSVPCSKEYWLNVAPLFQDLEKKKQAGLLWEQLPEKDDKIYVPLLEAFIDEVQKSYAAHSDIPEKMVEYLLGEFDFYKIISIDSERTTKINPFNLKGTLNQPAKNQKQKIIVPITLLPNEIVHIGFKKNSKNTVELYMNNGWQFSFRIHNAEKKVIPSLKFDIQIVGMPTSLITLNCCWN